jgi:hypothetical protein
MMAYGSGVDDGATVQGSDRQALTFFLQCPKNPLNL